MFYKYIYTRTSLSTGPLFPYPPTWMNYSMFKKWCCGLECFSYVCFCSFTTNKGSYLQKIRRALSQSKQLFQRLLLMVHICTYAHTFLRKIKRVLELCLSLPSFFYICKSTLKQGCNQNMWRFLFYQNWCTMQAGNPVYCVLEYTQSLNIEMLLLWTSYPCWPRWN